MLTAARMFRPASFEGAQQCYSLINRLRDDWLRLLTLEPRTDANTPEQMAILDVLDSTLKSLPPFGDHTPDPEATDPWKAILGVPAYRLVDGEGRFSPSLALAEFKDALPELSERLRVAFSGFPAPSLDSSNALRLLPALLNSVDPIETAEISLEIKDAILSSFTVDPEHTRKILNTLAAGAARSYSNSQMINHNLNPDPPALVGGVGVA